MRVCQIGHPAPPWLINYADLMTELVCFFVILYALSAALNKDMQDTSKRIKEMIEEGKMQGTVAIDKEGLRITLEEQEDQIFFKSGRAELTDDMKAALENVVPDLVKLSAKHDIVVEGHTDNIPIATRQFASNWELSTSRATNVVKALLARPGFNPAKMAAVGYGEYHPIAVNNAEENRKKNRRVVFFIKTNPYPDAKGLSPPPKKGVSATVITAQENVPHEAGEVSEAAQSQAPPALSAVEGPAGQPEAAPDTQEAAQREGR
ncbi:MAG: OmpA family protein [Elusimicrobia bacterium]|nr:OmpA family protein [Elusimicrobiota bacterium]